MGLHDRLSRTADGGHALTDVPSEVPADPYAELKAAVHHACIAKLGQELFKEDSTDLNDRVYKAVTEELETPERARIHLELDDVLISIDHPQAERIIENLVLNALTHTPSDSPVWIRTCARDGGVLVTVDDAGPGVPEHLHRAIFEPFRQADITEHAPGVGIGLSLVARFADIHGGRAWVEDRPEGGASFRVFLPGIPAKT